MKEINLLRIAIGSMFVFSILQLIPFALGQSQDTNKNMTRTDPAVTYAETARQLLNQTQMEYSKGNITGAEELATRAYLDNFEYVEAPLEQKGKHVLKENIENMMREELRGLIKDKVPLPQVSELINETDTKLQEAISILNNTK
ncbi:MAG: hypothetical protein ACM3JQ_00100 [Candidatus Eiseniibacteriota bacterium]